MYGFRMDVPNFIESCRKSFTAIDGTTSLVEVLWKGECKSDFFRENVTSLQDLDWVIVKTEERTFLDYDRNSRVNTHFTLRRKK